MNKHLKHVVFLSIWTFTVMVVWIALSVFFESEREQVSGEILSEVEGISPVFDRGVLDEVLRRKRVDVDLSAEIEPFTPEETVGSGSGLLDEN